MYIYILKIQPQRLFVYVSCIYVYCIVNLSTEKI